MKKKKSAKRQVTPRKLPVQQRSRANVERILEAAAVLLDEKGYDHLTTASIASQAGCSIGSIYQYFPNKHAIMTSLVERWLAADNEVLEQVEKNQGQYESVVDEFLALTEKLVQVYREQKGVFALVTLIRNIPELHQMAEVHDRQYAIRLMKIMNRYLPKGDNPERLALAGFFTIVVDAAAMSIATETPKRARFKHRFLLQTVRDLFEGCR
jgi:AcrR family transcriptional regulator